MGSKLDFTGKRVLVTGGGHGIGLGIVKKFLEHNATVVVLEKDESLLQSLKASHPSVIGVQVDLSSWEATTKAVESVLPIHHLANNAGILPASKLIDATEEHIDAIFNVNFKAYVHVAQIVAKDMIKNKIKGTIVNTSSIGDHRCIIKDYGAGIYCCSKAAVTTFTRILAAELSSSGIRVNCVRPATTNTGIGGDLLEQESIKAIIDLQLHQRMIEPEEVGDSVVFLSSEMSSMITGSSITIDGGVDYY